MLKCKCCITQGQPPIMLPHTHSPRHAIEHPLPPPPAATISGPASSSESEPHSHSHSRPCSRPYSQAPQDYSHPSSVLHPSQPSSTSPPRHELPHSPH